MWECPCIANIDGKDVFVFSPQYTTLEGRGNSTNHNVYLVGKMDYDTLTFTPETDYRYLDYGFDFYAAQMAANVNDDKKAIMITWIGLPDNHYPTEEEDYEGSMTIARELRLKGNRIVQSPVKAIEQLREECDEEEGKLSKAMEMLVDFNEGDASLHLFTKENGEGGFTIDYNANTKTITVDKSHMDKRFNEHVFETLDVPLDEDLKNMRIFIDSSSVEIFINDGLYTFTAHVYPTEKECGYTHSDNVSVSRYKLKASVKDDFVV
jgi:beta-fructofuranosidase